MKRKNRVYKPLSALGQKAVRGQHQLGPLLFLPFLRTA
jgi:hypothetical protein